MKQIKTYEYTYEVDKEHKILYNVKITEQPEVLCISLNDIYMYRQLTITQTQYGSEYNNVLEKQIATYTTKDYYTIFLKASVAVRQYERGYIISRSDAQLLGLIAGVR